jgi:large subunit ribosomal protein L24
MAALGIKTGDTVEVITGKDRGKRGKVVSAEPGAERLVVEGRNLAKRHTKPRPVPGGQQMAPGGILDQEQALRRSNVMLVCPSCDKPTRTGRNDSGARVCRKCGTEIDR